MQIYAILNGLSVSRYKFRVEYRNGEHHQREYALRQNE